MKVENLHHRSMFSAIVRSTTAFMAVCFLVSCMGNTLFERNEEIKNHQWDLNSPALFEVTVNDTTKQYNIYVNIRNTDKYQYSNMYLFLTSQYPDGRYEKDTLEVILADDMGYWKGSGLGDLFYNQFLFAKDIRFPLSGTYKFTLQHGMRTNPLPGIADIGIRIEQQVKK